MPNSVLTPENALLIIVDLQVGHLPSIKSMAPERLVQEVVLLRRIADLFEIPVLVTVSKQAAPQGTLVPDLCEAWPFTPLIGRTIINAWEDEIFRLEVEKSGRTHLIFAGVALEVGVALPAMRARQDGFAVTIPIDAVGTTDSRIENAALMTLCAAGVQVTSVQAIGMGLLGNIQSPHAPPVLHLLGSAHSQSENPFR